MTDVFKKRGGEDLDIETHTDERCEDTGRRLEDHAPGVHLEAKEGHGLLADTKG